MSGAEVILQASQASHLGRLVPQEAAARNQKAANGPISAWRRKEARHCCAGAGAGSTVAGCMVL